jgi:DNA-binding transcriptional ArsR family regulator
MVQRERARQGARLDMQVSTCICWRVSDIYHAISAEARRIILDELQRRNGQTLFELCTRLTMEHGLGMSRQAVSQHLDVLESAGLVTTERQGRCKFHYLDIDPLKAIGRRWPGAAAEEEER